jgi:uncharacterized membrane protein
MPAPPERTEHASLSRIGTFSDGVFAIAITLLVLAIRIPHPTDADAGRGLLALLTEQWRSYLAFVLSFMLVGINWANHRVMFKTFSRADHTLVWLNLLYLMVGVVFIPVPTAVLGAWLGDPANQVVAAVFYGATGTVGALLFVLLWWKGRTSRSSPDPSSARQSAARTGSPGHRRRLSSRSSRLSRSSVRPWPWPAISSS